MDREYRDRSSDLTSIQARFTRKEGSLSTDFRDASRLSGRRGSDDQAPHIRPTKNKPCASRFD